MLSVSSLRAVGAAYESPRSVPCKVSLWTRTLLWQVMLIHFLTSGVSNHTVIQQGCCFPSPLCVFKRYTQRKKMKGKDQTDEMRFLLSVYLARRRISADLIQIKLNSQECLPVEFLYPCAFYASVQAIATPGGIMFLGLSVRPPNSCARNI